jgi:hypothetical protein
MVEPLRHRQTKEAATDMFDLQPPRHMSTLPGAADTGYPLYVRFSEAERTRFARSELFRVCDPNVWSGRALQEVFLDPADAVSR